MPKTNISAIFKVPMELIFLAPLFHKLLYTTSPYLSYFIIIIANLSSYKVTNFFMQETFLIRIADPMESNAMNTNQYIKEKLPKKT